MAKRNLVWMILTIFSSIVIFGGCGDGGGGGGAVPPSTKLSGTAAVGEALANAEVMVKSIDGETATAVTDQDGKYTLDVAAMQSPFLLKVSYGNTVLFGVANDPGIANLHPFTDLLIQNWYAVQGTDVKTVFDAQGAIDPAPPTKTELDTMQSVIKSLLSALKPVFDFTDFDFVTSAFDADGTGFDHMLEWIDVDTAANTISVSLVEPETGTTLDEVLDLSADNTLGSITDIQNKIAANVAQMQDTVNNKGCALTDANLAPYVTANNFMFMGWDVSQMAEMFKYFVCPNGNTKTDNLTLSAEYLSYDQQSDIMGAKLRLENSSGHREGTVIRFGQENGNWVWLGDGLPVEIGVRSKVKYHQRPAGPEFEDVREVEVCDYQDLSTAASVTAPDRDFPLSLICDSFDGDPSNDCDEMFPAKCFQYKDNSPLKGDYQVHLNEGLATTDYGPFPIKKVTGIDHDTQSNDFPLFQDITTHTLSDVCGAPLTAKVYTPEWVSEVAKPYVSLWDGATLLDDELNASWVGTPRPGQYNQFSVTIPCTYNGSTVTQAVLGQDAMTELLEGWGMTAVYWYFE
ncbi:MAG: carboxypeptidase regulatory-like domain-containing protein [Deltaproteobacteria bacterium]|nr:carboxypeptidase regulatory-like domain-containing protein [Deltaproteobacteria bacterium]